MISRTGRDFGMAAATFGDTGRAEAAGVTEGA